MKRPVYFTSVPHTGTRFFLEMINPIVWLKGYKLKQRVEPRPLIWRPFVASHIFRENMPVIYDYIEAYNPILICTQRDIKAVEQSWKSRGRPIDELHECIQLADEFIERCNPTLISVDADDREEMLLDLGNALSAEFKTDWQRTGSFKDGDRTGMQR
jgi:hypothetical protein